MGDMLDTKQPAPLTVYRLRVVVQVLTVVRRQLCPLWGFT